MRQSRFIGCKLIFAHHIESVTSLDNQPINPTLILSKLRLSSSLKKKKQEAHKSPQHQKSQSFTANVVTPKLFVSRHRRCSASARPQCRNRVHLQHADLKVSLAPTKTRKLLLKVILVFMKSLFFSAAAPDCAPLCRHPSPSASFSAQPCCCGRPAVIDTTSRSFCFNPATQIYLFPRKKEKKEARWGTAAYGDLEQEIIRGVLLKLNHIHEPAATDQRSVQPTGRKRCKAT